MSNVIAEIPWSSMFPQVLSFPFLRVALIPLCPAVLMGVVIYFTWYYPIGYYRNAIPTDAVHLRGALMFLYIEMFMLFTSTFAIMIVAGIDTAETAGNIANLLFLMCLIFCGWVLLSYPSFCTSTSRAFADLVSYQ